MRAYVLCLVLLSPCVLGQSVNERYKKFINKHIKPGMSQTRCDTVMRSRHITYNATSKACKETNTFILASATRIKTMCGKAGKPYQQPDKRASLQPFPVINCKQRNNKRYPHCEYRGRSDTRYIVLSCDQGFPVHFAGFAN